jgi:hypothetical protein
VHDPQGGGELVVGVDSDADPPGRGIDQMRGAPAPEDAGLGVRLVGAAGDLPVRGASVNTLKKSVPSLSASPTPR